MSHQHEGHNNFESVSGEFFKVDGPGEYEIKGIMINGINGFHDQNKGKDRGLNTIYIIEMDGIKVCHLGDFNQLTLSDSQLEAIGNIDILMIPVGGQNTIGADKAVGVIEQLDPKLVIPMHYKVPNLNAKLNGVEVFLKEMGISDKKTQDKLVLKKKDLLNKDMEVIVMKV
jgi:L-ascorbate metabolism protein UlaG (beta-lactamase superfamily)